MNNEAQLTVSLPMRLVGDLLRMTKQEDQPMHVVIRALLEEALARRWDDAVAGRGMDDEPAAG